MNSVKEAEEHCKVAQAALNTLTVYVDWISSNFLFEENGHLLQLLCAMLNERQLQLPAVECLLVITSRKVAPLLWNCFYKDFTLIGYFFLFSGKTWREKTFIGSIQWRCHQPFTNSRHVKSELSPTFPRGTFHTFFLLLYFQGDWANRFGRALLCFLKETLPNADGYWRTTRCLMGTILPILSLSPTLF